MKKVMDVIAAAVGFLLLATIIILTITYFNRGKDVVTKNADGVLSVVENESAVADLVSYDGKTITGSSVTSLIDQLVTNNLDIPVLVFTNSRKTVAEYTKAGATDYGSVEITSTGAYVTYKGQIITGIASITPATGNYRASSDVTYINPKVNYEVTCYYTTNKALSFIVIMQQTD